MDHDKIKELLSAKDPSVIIITGPRNSGKTTGIAQILDEMTTYDPYYFNSSTTRNSKELQDLYYKTANIISIIQKPKLAVFDDLEILVQLDRMYISTMIDLINKFKTRIPVIILVTPSITKKITIPGIRIIIEKGKISANPPSSTALTDILAGPSKNIKRSHISRAFLEDPWLNPLRFHENLPRELGNRRATKKNKINAYISYLDALCNWDLFMTKGHSDYAVEFITSSICTHLSDLPRLKNAPEASMADFTKVLSQLSLQKKRERHNYNSGLFCI